MHCGFGKHCPFTQTLLGGQSASFAQPGLTTQLPCTQIWPIGQSLSLKHFGIGKHWLLMHTLLGGQSASTLQPPIGGSQMPLKQSQPIGQSPSTMHWPVNTQV